MLKGEKKFGGTRRYYHRHEETALPVPVNPSWEERQKMFRRAHQLRILRILGVILLCGGVVLGAFYLLRP